jgi:hypothetical protein
METLDAPASTDSDRITIGAFTVIRVTALRS